MPNADRLILVATAALALAACGQSQQQGEQNIVIDNAVDPNAQIETLPADESSTTPSNVLVNGADDPDLGDVDQPANSY